MGTIITMPLSGLLTKYGFDGGWASVFYCFGEWVLPKLHSEITQYSNPKSLEPGCKPLTKLKDATHF